MFWSPSRIFLSIEIFQGCILVTYGLHILVVPMGSQNFATHFLDETLSQDMAHINDLSLLGDTRVVLDILFSCATHLYGGLCPIYFSKESNSNAFIFVF